MEPLDDERVLIEVTDHGIGFDERFLDRIFKPFQRVCDKNIYEGSGIGNCFIRKPASFEGFVEIMERLNKFWFELVEIPALD